VIAAGNGLILRRARPFTHECYPRSRADRERADRETALLGLDWGFVRPHRALASELAEASPSVAATAWEETAVARAKRRVFPGRHEQVAQTRRFVARALKGCPVADEAILCVSELATNTLLHTASGNEGEFEVIVQRGRSWVRIAVCDEGSSTIPAPRALDATSEDGRGLGLVALIAHRWGHWTDEHGRTVWCELWCDPPGDPRADAWANPA
jgi:anti-sigma regulatory factor (Ser/Thr protein kinase)